MNFREIKEANKLIDEIKNWIVLQWTFKTLKEL